MHVWRTYPRPLRKSLGFGFACQSIGLLLGALVLDGGVTLRVCAIAAIAYNLAVFWILRGDIDRVTQGDHYFIRHGFLLLFIIAMFMTPLIWAVIGESPCNGLQRLIPSLRNVA